MTFSHSKKQFDNLIKKKSNFIFYKKILKLNSDPIPSFINLVEKINIASFMSQLKKVVKREDTLYVDMNH
jgi:hypothetical protein